MCSLYMLRKAEKNEKKRAIALAAIPLLAELGLAKTSVEAIAKRQMSQRYGLSLL